MRENKKVVVAGHICLDITPLFSQDSSIEEPFIKPGKLVNIGNARVSTGGSVANTGLALDLLGLDVSMIGKIGNDEFGRLILDCFEKYRIAGVNDMIISPNASTSYSVILAPAGCDRMFLHFPGANDTFSTSDLDYSRIRDAAIFHFGYPPLMAHMYENDGDDLVRMFQDVKSLGVATSLDLACMDHGNNVGAATANWKFILKRVLPYVDFFLPSAEEICMMIDSNRYNEWLERANGNDICEYLDVEKDVKPLADLLVEHFHAKVVVIKCGCKGLYYKTAGSSDMSNIGANAAIKLSAWADKEGYIKAYAPDVYRSATGCGDAAIAAFLAGVLEGMTIKDCARLAAAEGACCLEGIDSFSTLRTIPELQQAFLMGL